MSELIFQKKQVYSDEYTSDLTKKLDEFLYGKLYSYMYKYNIHNVKYIIRVPGMTIGKIVVDDSDVIIDIRLYPNNEEYFVDSKFTLEYIEKEIRKFIGYKITIKE